MIASGMCRIVPEHMQEIELGLANPNISDTSEGNTRIFSQSIYIISPDVYRRLRVERQEEIKYLQTNHGSKSCN